MTTSKAVRKFKNECRHALFIPPLGRDVEAGGEFEIPAGVEFVPGGGIAEVKKAPASKKKTESSK